MSAPNFHPPYWDSSAAAPRFSVGKRVRVLRDLGDGPPRGHCRTPWMVRGRVGVVERICGHFANPEDLAYGRDGLPKRALYRVRFALSQIWEPSSGFAAEDTIDVEIYEHWLEPFFDYDGDPVAEAAKIAKDIERAG